MAQDLGTQRKMVLAALENALKRNPELRVGQLIWNAVDPEKLFYMKDEDLAKILYQYSNGQ